jgi:hypothetical protein
MIAMTLLSICVALFGIGIGGLMLRQDSGRKGQIVGTLFAIAGILAGWWIYSTDRQMRRETLFEVMAEGSEGAKVGAPAPLRTLEFNVKHPGVGHTLMVSPSSYMASSPSGEVELSFQLLDPEGKELLQNKRTYAVRSGTRGSKADWEAAYFPFTPAQAGKHTLALTILTVDVPHVHVRVVDPENTDGVRIPGF